MLSVACEHRKQSKAAGAQVLEDSILTIEAAITAMGPRVRALPFHRASPRQRCIDLSHHPAKPSSGAVLLTRKCPRVQMHLTAHLAPAVGHVVSRLQRVEGFCCRLRPTVTLSLEGQVDPRVAMASVVLASARCRKMEPPGAELRYQSCRQYSGNPW